LDVIADTEGARMIRTFRRVRRRLERLRRYNRSGRAQDTRDQAAAIRAAAAAVGCRCIAAQAERLVAVGGYIATVSVDDLEAQVDAAEAIWHSSRCVI
jgi:hypothetical protein